MAISVQAASCIKRKESRDVLSGQWLVQLVLVTTFCSNMLISLFCEVSPPSHNVFFFLYPQRICIKHVFIPRHTIVAGYNGVTLDV